MVDFAAKRVEMLTETDPSIGNLLIARWGLVWTRGWGQVELDWIAGAKCLVGALDRVLTQRAGKLCLTELSQSDGQGG